MMDPAVSISTAEKTVSASFSVALPDIFFHG